MQLIENQSGAIQINEADTWHTLSTENDIELQQGGYLAIYISNESMESVTYFDNVRIKFYRGKLLEENHYYPFGMALRISQDASVTKNKNLYQGKEFNTTANINWYDFHARQYDPLLARFTSVDPAGQFASGYVGMGNNPTNSIDPDGRTVSGMSPGFYSNNASRAIKMKNEIEAYKKRCHDVLVLYRKGMKELQAFMFLAASEMNSAGMAARNEAMSREQAQNTRLLHRELQDMLPKGAPVPNGLEDMQRLLSTILTNDYTKVWTDENGNINSVGYDVYAWYKGSKKDDVPDIFDGYQIVENGKSTFTGRPDNTSFSNGDDLDLLALGLGGGGAELRGSLNDWGNYLGFGVGAAEYNLGKIIADRAKYTFTKAPYETRVPIKGNITIRTPVGNLSVNASKLANGLKWGGRALGGTGIVLTGIQALNGDIGYGEAVLDASFGVVGFLGPVGFVVSSTYFFVAKPLYNYYTKP